MSSPYVVEMTEKTRWVLVENISRSGYVTDSRWLEAIYRDDPSICPPGETRIAEEMTGYGVRWTMPGYTDCGEWELFTVKREAEKAARALQRELDGEDF